MSALRARRPGRGVMIRGAALLAAGVNLPGCGLVGGGGASTTTSSSAEPSSNPWELPIEQRPALFDPCTELPVEAVEQGLGGPVEPIESYENHDPGGLMACGWENDQADISVLSTWKSRDEYLADKEFTVEDSAHELAGRTGMRLRDANDMTERSCLQLFFTERGSVWVRLDLSDLFREFKGERPADACWALERALQPLIGHFPDGDYT